MEIDQEYELARAKWLMFGAAMLLLSCCFSYEELMYLVSGRDAQADVTKVYDSHDPRRGTSRTMEYAFTEPDGTRRKGMESVPTDWTPPQDGKIGVRYTPGADGSARLAGRGRWTWVTIFAISVIVVLVIAIRLLREGAEEPKPRKRKR